VFSFKVKDTNVCQVNVIKIRLSYDINKIVQCFANQIMLRFISNSKHSSFLYKK